MTVVKVDLDLQVYQEMPVVKVDLDLQECCEDGCRAEYQLVVRGVLEGEGVWQGGQSPSIAGWSTYQCPGTTTGEYQWSL
mmetsp:Transcript_1863/g.3833  ORF Transcript_1863/g.3833 Transcript_1863/m.3833 type:complete len:80 (+) Transcript_1863:133-372(+)